MSAPERRLTVQNKPHTLLTELSRPGRITGGLEVAALLEAWGFERRGRVEVLDPEEVQFWIHPKHPDLHMTVPIGSPLSQHVVDYAGYLIRFLRNR